MMYGFGDDKNPYTESVDLLEDIVIEFITEMTHKAMEIGRTGRVQVEDIIFLVRKDQRKYARVKDLLTMNEELKKARKAFDEIKYVGKYEIQPYMLQELVLLYLQVMRQKSNDKRLNKKWFSCNYFIFNLCILV